MKNSSISDYILALASSAPAPGGGSSAALSGAMAAALVSMVANLTIGREKYAAFEILARDSQARAEILSRELCDCIQKDMDAYSGVVTALRLPKSTDEEKAKRLEELQAERQRRHRHRVPGRGEHRRRRRHGNGPALHPRHQ